MGGGRRERQAAGEKAAKKSWKESEESLGMESPNSSVNAGF